MEPAGQVTQAVAPVPEKDPVAQGVQLVEEFNALYVPVPH